MSEIRLKKIHPEAVVPTYGTDFSAGADLYALLEGESVTVAPGEQYMVHTGISLEIPDGYAGFIFARSGLASKKGLAPANKVGVIDSDYRGEIMIPLFNHSASEKTIANKERVAQIVFLPYLKADFLIADELDDSERAAGGFGSTGEK